MRRWARRASAMLLAVIAVGPTAGPLAGPVAAQEDGGTAALRADILQSARIGDHREAANLADRYLEANPGDAVMLYNAACFRCRAGDLPQAEALLLRALGAGFSDFSWMQRDPDLVPLRDRHLYRTILRARDAADPVLAGRQREKWHETLGREDYRVLVDETRRLSYVTALDDRRLAALVTDVAQRSHFLVSALFPEPLRYAVLIVVPDGEQRDRLLPGSHVHGSYRHRTRLLLAADGGRALRHELVHVFHHNHMDHLGQTHPMWVQEGLACLYESADLESAGAPAIRPNERDAIASAMAASGALPEWSTFLALSDREFLSDPGVHYAQARSILLYLADRERLDAWYEEYARGFDSDPTGASALQATFGLPLEVIEADWRAWLELREDDRRLVQVGAAFEPMTGPALPFADPLGDDAEAEAFDELDFVDEALASAWGLYREGDYEAAVEALRDVVELDPGHAAARYALGLAYLRTSDLTAAREQERILDGLDRSLGSLLGNLTRR